MANGLFIFSATRSYFIIVDSYRSVIGMNTASLCRDAGIVEVHKEASGIVGGLM
jgi:hypothetical protein